MREAVIEPLAPMGGGVCVTQRGLHPDLSVAHLGREGRRLVGPQIESAAAFEVEAGVVPMTGQDPVLDAAPVEREAHVRATVVEGEDAPAVIDDKDRAMGAMQDDPALCLHLFEGPCKGEVRVRQVHERTSLNGFFSGRCPEAPRPSARRSEECAMFVPQTALSIGANMGHPCKPPAASPSCRCVKQRAGIKMIRQAVLAFRPAQAEGFAICDARTLPLAEG